jgi:WD40 repeat protein
LRSSLRQWQESGQDEGALLAGAPLAVAHDWLSQRSGELNTAEIAYIQASQALQTRQQKERQRRRRWTVIGLTAGLVIAIILTAFALVQRQEAETQRQAALLQASAGLAAQALAELEGTQSERAVLLALEALEHYPYTPQAEAALARAVQEILSYTEYPIPLGEAGITVLTWSPDGKYIAVGGESDFSGSNAVKIWGAGKKQVIMELPIVIGFNEYVSSMAWSPDSNRLAVAINDPHNFLVFDTNTGTELFTLETHGEYALDWSPDGKMLLSGSEDGMTRLWDATNGTLLRELPGQTLDVVAARFSPDGTRVATASRDGTVIIRDTANGNLLFTFGEVSVTEINREEEVQYESWLGLAWSPDGTQLASGTAEGTVEVWDTTSGEKILDLMGHTGFITNVKWSSDGRYLATNSMDYSIRLWEAASGKQILVLNGRWWTLDFSPDGKYLTSSYGNLRLWDLSTLPPSLPYPPDPTIWGDVKWSPDGHFLATNTVVHDVTQDYQGWKTNLMGLIDWSPDSTRLVGSLMPGAAIVDAATGDVLVELKTPAPGPDNFYYTHAWSPDGKLVASSAA